MFHNYGGVFNDGLLPVSLTPGSSVAAATEGRIFRTFTALPALWERVSSGAGGVRRFRPSLYLLNARIRTRRSYRVAALSCLTLK